MFSNCCICIEQFTDPCGGAGDDGGADDFWFVKMVLNCVGMEFCNEDCVSANYDGCVTGDSTWIGDGYCDDGSWVWCLHVLSMQCDGCDCSGDDGGFSTDGCSADCDYTEIMQHVLNHLHFLQELWTLMVMVMKMNATQMEQHTYSLIGQVIAVTAEADSGYDQDCDETTGVGCDFEAGDAEDFSSLGDGYWYGWDANYSDYWTVTFGDVSVSAEATTGDCDDDGAEGCAPGYVEDCDGSGECHELDW